MTARPPRDVRADTKTVLARVLRNSGHIAPEHLTLELLAALDGAGIGLTDLRHPANPDADPLTRIDPDRIAPTDAPEPTAGVAEYLAARTSRPTEPRFKGPSQ